MACCILLASFVITSAADMVNTYHFKSLDKQFDAIARQLDNLDYANERAKITTAQLQALQQRAKALGNSQLEARAIFWQVRAGQMDAQPVKCIQLLERALSLCADGYEYDRACIQYQLAGNHERMGHYLQTYNLLLSAIPVLKEHDDNFFLGNAYLLLTQLFVDINDPENAKAPLEQAKHYYVKADYPLNRIYFYEALLSEDGNSKINLFKKSIATGKKDWGMTLQAMVNVASEYIDAGHLDSAGVYVRMAENEVERNQSDNPIFSAIVDIAKAQLAYVRDNSAQVLAILSREERNKAVLTGERMMADVYKYMWLAHEKTGNIQAAHKYLKLYQAEYERNNREVRKQDVPKAKARDSIARRNDIIKLLEQDAELSRRYMYMMIMAFVLVLIVGIGIFVYFFQRYKIRRIENRELRNNLTQEALIYSVNRKNYERDIKQKECEISSSTLLLANKNEVLQQISDITKRYSDEGQIPHEYVKQINDAIGDSLRNDDEWDRFKLHFDSVHPSFFIKLKEVSKELTENDLRLCAYIRIGMRAKQIAEMLSVSPDSVNSNRYRLRKKFALQRSDSLDDFIRKI